MKSIFSTNSQTPVENMPLLPLPPYAHDFTQSHWNMRMWDPKHIGKQKRWHEEPSQERLSRRTDSLTELTARSQWITTIESVRSSYCWIIAIVCIVFRVAVARSNIICRIYIFGFNYVLGFTADSRSFGYETRRLSHLRYCARSRNGWDWISIMQFFNSAVSCEFAVICID